MGPDGDVIKVLILDDELHAREAPSRGDCAGPVAPAIQACLEDGGYVTYCASGRSEATDVLTDHGCDVVVADVTTLGAHGPTLLERMHDLDEHLPLIIVTDEPDATAAASVRRLGAYDYISRPLVPAKLTHLVARAAERKRLLDERRHLRAEKQAFLDSLRREVARRTADLERTNQELKTLTKIGREVSATLDLTQVLKRVTQLAADVCGAHRCTILLIGGDGEMSTPAMSGFSDGHKDQEMWRLFTDKSYPVPLSEVPEAQQVVREQSPLFIPDVQASELPKHLIEPFGIKSVLLVPLVSKKWIVGLMALDHVEEGRCFTTRQIDLATSIAAQATLAIENARLYEQARRQARHGALLSVVAQQANTIVEPERLLPVVANTIQEQMSRPDHLRYDSVILMLVDQESGNLTIGGKAGQATEMVPDDYQQPLDQGMMGWVARHGECLASNDASQENRYFAPFPDRYRAGSELAVPLKIEGKVVGVLDLQCQGQGSFDELDTATACTLAEQIATGLQNARLYDQAQSRAVQLQAAVEVARGATAILDVDELLSETVHLICDRFDFHRAAVYLLDDERERAVLRAAFTEGGQRMTDRGYDLAVEGGVTALDPVVEVARTGEPRIASRMSGERSSRVAEEHTDLDLPDMRSQMALPLVSRGVIIGVLDVQSKEENAFGKEDEATLQAMADQLSNALENARLYEAAQQRVAELEAVRQAGLHVTSSLELQPVLEAILESALQLVQGADAHVFVYDGKQVSFGAAMWAGQVQQEPYAEPRPDGVTYTVAQSGMKLVIPNTRNHPLFQDSQFAGWSGAIVALPLKIGDQVQGVMNIAFDEPHAFSTDELGVLELLADQAAIALENARLYREEQRHVEELTALRNIDLAITSTLSLDEVLERIYEQLRGLMDINTFYIGVYNRRKQILQIPLIVDQGDRLDPLALDLQEEGGFAGWVVRNKEPLWVEDWEREQESLPVEGIARGKPTQSLMVLPLLARDELVGVISAQSYAPNAFDEDDLRLLSGISHQVAIAIENARLFEEVNRRLKEMRLLQKIIRASSSTLDFNEVVARTMKTLQDTLGIQNLIFALPDEEKSTMVMHRSTASSPSGSEGLWHLPMDDSIVGRVYRTGESLLFTNVRDVSSSLDGAPAERTELAVPVWDGDEVVAVLNAESPVLEDFDEDDLSLFSAVAAQLGVVLKNVRLFQQTRRRLTETRLLQQVMQAGAVSLDFDNVLERTVEALHRMLDIKHLSFALPIEDGVDGSPTALKLHPSLIGYAPEMANVRIPLDRSVAGRAYLTGEAQLIDDVRQTPAYFQGAPEVLSELNVPVRVAGRVIAVLNAESPKTNAFDDDDLRLFQAVAAQLGIVLENARLYQRLQEQRDELSQAYDELKEIDRLRTELVQNVSHELRTPFTLVQGYIELLMAGDLGPLLERQREALTIIRKRVDALQRRTRDLTTLDSVSREQPARRSTCVLEALQRAVTDLEAQAANAGVRLSEDMPDVLPPVMADMEHLVQAFTHLIDNAIKFSPEGGTVTIRAWEDGDRSCVAVEDEGIGIRQEHLDHIFERFYQVDGSINRRFGGMGIGLALVCEIVEVYGGCVSVQSSPQAGSTFVVSLPRAESQSLRREVSITPPGSGGRPRTWREGG